MFDAANEYAPPSWNFSAPTESLNDPVSQEELTVGAAAIGFDKLPDTGQIAWIQPDGGDIRLSLAASAAVGTGLLLANGSIWTLYGRKTLQAASFISNLGGNVTLHIIYFTLTPPTAEIIMSLYPDHRPNA